jgi:hypothetical protein
MKKTISLLVSFLLFLQIIPSAIAADVIKDTSSESSAKSSTYISPEKKSPIVFTALGLNWHESEPAGTQADVFVRFKDKDVWSDWNKLENDNGEVESDNNTGDISTFIAVNETDTFQYKIFLNSQAAGITPTIEKIAFTYINAREKVENVEDKLFSSIVPATMRVASSFGTPVEATVKTLSTVASASSSTVKIISRNSWGADESLRIWTDTRPESQNIKVEDGYYEKYKDELKIVKTVSTNSDGKELTWPLQYPAKVSKIVIHHTATTNNLDNPEQAIRDIYYFHTISRGWGDIGYNYIIDKNGNIYEGRAGGDSVVGAHAGKANVGSIGIAVLGNYQTNDVPAKVINSLTSLIKVKVDKYGIDPEGSSMFRGETIPNIIGHRDVMATSCPGDKFYNLIPSIRSKIKGTFVSKVIDKRRNVDANKLYDYSLVSSPSVEAAPGETKKVSITLKNIGSQKWGAETYLIVSNDANSKELILASDKMTRSANIGKTVSAGSSATFTMNLQASYKAGMGNLEVFPFIDGKTKVEKYVAIPFQIGTPSFDYSIVKITTAKTYLKKGEKTTAMVELKNTGNVTWKNGSTNGAILLGTQKPQDRLSQLLEVNGNRLAQLKESEVKPGGIGHFTVNITAPEKEGSLHEYFAPVIEGISWLAFKNSSIDIYVYDSLYLARLNGTTGDLNFLPGEKRKITLNYVNLGGAIWKKSGNDSLSFDLKPEKGLTITKKSLVQKQVLPGQTANLDVSITAPKTPGTYKIAVSPKLGSTKLSSANDYIYIKVASKVATGSVVSQAATNVAHAEQPVEDAVSKAGSMVQNIKVALSFKGSPIISANGVFKVLNDGKEIARFAKDEKVSVTYGQNEYRIRSDKNYFAISNPPRFEPVNGSILRVDNYEHRPAWDTSYNDNEYRGSIQIYQYSSALQVVNELPIEDYLKGLAEISATDPYEKVKSVIVLARTYAYFYANKAEKFPGAPYNLTDDPERSQKYLGYGFEKRNKTGVKAVADTIGKVITYNGVIIKTPYFSSDDGRTRSAQEVWGWTNTPYLVSVDDPGCKGKTMQGHGVGLSGCGSLYLANQGKSYSEIIGYFFKGVKVSDQSSL